MTQEEKNQLLREAMTLATQNRDYTIFEDALNKYGAPTNFAMNFVGYQLSYMKATEKRYEMTAKIWLTNVFMLSKFRDAPEVNEANLATFTLSWFLQLLYENPEKTAAQLFSDLYAQYVLADKP